MPERLRHVLRGSGALVAVLVLLMAAAVARAEPTVAIEPTTMRDVWSSMSFTTSASTVRCPVTLEGSFQSSTFAPVSGAQVGHVTRASVTEASCTGGRVRFLTETLPWRVQYESSTGTLPEISGIRLKVIGVAVRGEASGVTCLYQSSESRPLKATLEVTPGTVPVTGLRVDETARIPLVTREFFCEVGGEGGISGTATVTESGSANQVNVAVVNDDAPLIFTPGSNITLPAGTTSRDVTIEATSNRTLGTLVIRGDRTGEFHVSNGCNGQIVGPTANPRTCTMTVSYTGGIANRGAYVEVPVGGLTRWIYIHRP